MALLLCLGTFFSGHARAEESYFVDLKEQPGDCIQRAELQEAVVKELGPVVVPEGLRVEAKLGESLGFILTDHGAVVAERRFDTVPPACDAQLRMLSVVIAMAIEHKLSGDNVQQAASTEQSAKLVPPPVESPPKEATSSPPASRPERPRKSPDVALREKQKTWGVRGSSGVGYSFGVLPVPAPVLTAELGVVVFRRWSVELGMIVTDRMRIGFDVEGRETSGATTPDEAFSQAIGQLVGGKLQGCWEQRLEGAGIGLCGGLAAGQFHARGVEGFHPNPGEAVPWLAGFTRLSGRVPARGPFGVSLNADVFGNFLRPGVELTGEGSAESPLDTPVMGGAVSLGMFFVLQ